MSHASRGRTAATPSREEQLLESAFEDAPIGMALVAADGRVLRVNEALCTTTGHTRDALLAGALAPLMAPPADRGGHVDGTSEQPYLDGHGRPGWVMLVAARARAAADVTPHRIVQVLDISERKDMERRVGYLIDHDLLTGAFNRRRFEQDLAAAVERARRYAHAGAVVMLDLDGFKDVNDALGHKAGDDLLRGVTATLRGRLRASDVLARLGGDEFAVLLPEATPEESELIAKALVRSVAQHASVLGDREIRVTASAGVAAFGELDGGQALAHADHAMYEAKGRGKNRVVVDGPADGFGARASDRLDEVERLRRALSEDRFELWSQPILDIAAGRVSQHELLLRLREGDVVIPPGSFLYAAERFGLIQEIDCWVVGQAVELIAAHARAGAELTLEVNLSGRSIGSREVAATVEELVVGSGIDASRLIFEVTETSVIANIEEAGRFARRMRELGARFALDDFGSGFGAFYYLKSLPFDFIKIDGDFVRGLGSSRTDELIVEAIARIADGMGKRTIAEFVADESSLTVLQRLGVDYAQGFHVGEARPVSETLPPPAA